MKNIKKSIFIILAFILGLNFVYNYASAEELSNTSDNNSNKFPPFSRAIEKNLKRTLEASPNSYSILKKLGDLYCDREDFANAEIYYVKAINVNMNEQDLNKLGLIFYLQDDYSNAIKCFNLSLKLNPSNEKTKRKILFIESQIPQLQELEKIRTLEPKCKAPKDLHQLISVEGKLKDINDEKKLHKIIDFIWSDAEGRFLLQTILNIQLPIVLKKNIASSQLGVYQTSPTDDSITYSNGSNHSNVYSPSIQRFLYIKEKDISDFQSPDSTVVQNMKPIATIAHLLCHLLRTVRNQKFENSQEEEFISDIIGLNIASRILTNSSLTKEQVLQYGSVTYNLLFKPSTTNYHYLPRGTEYAKFMKEIGFELPYYDIYSNLDNLKFKEKNNVEFKNYVKTISKNHSNNYDSIYTNVYPFNYYYFGIGKNGVVDSLFNTPNLKGYKKFDKETLFNLNIAVYSEPFPDKYKDTLIPVILRRTDKHVRLQY